MTAAVTLYEFLEGTGAQVRAFDIGRRVGALGRELFLAFEQASAPYPRPMQHKAWFALVQLPAGVQTEPVIWFLRLGLDEQGLLVQAERDHLLNLLLESAHTQAQDTDPRAALSDNPYAFTPRDDRMALFHALLSVDLGLPPSRFYAHALDYFHGRSGWDQWGFVGYQGIADVACRATDEPLTTAIPQLPREPLVALCHCLESRPLGTALVQALQDRLRATLREPAPDVGLVAALLRGLSASSAQAQVATLIGEVLAKPVGGHIEILAAISGRAWEVLLQPALLDAFLRRLAGNEHGQTAFQHCVRDLLSLPNLAGPVRLALRSPDQSVAVREAFARMTDSGR
ncbi:MAG: DUF3549 family protein [Chromatiaceae bacterium]|nr:DUF3549 family protein [Chromatiaceae bacterium]